MPKPKSYYYYIHLACISLLVAPATCKGPFWQVFFEVGRLEKAVFFLNGGFTGGSFTHLVKSGRLPRGRASRSFPMARPLFFLVALVLLPWFPWLDTSSALLCCGCGCGYGRLFCGRAEDVHAQPVLHSMPQQDERKV